MLRRRIAGMVCSVAFSALALVVLPGVAPAATSPSPSSPASADPGGYPAQGPLLTVTSGTVKVGGSVTVNGHGFQSGEVVDISVTYGPASHALGSGGPVAQLAAFTRRHGVEHTVVAAHAVAAQTGDFSAQVALTKTGNATITAIGEQSHLSVAATVSVVPATSVATAKSTKRTLPLSNTGLLILGLVIVAALAAAGVLGLRGRWRGSSSAEHDVSTA
ncbi:MAG TPA: hypothetical protein VIJ31_03825 [Acidothermaceae bacterium]